MLKLYFKIVLKFTFYRHQRRNNLNHPGEEKEKQKTRMKVVRVSIPSSSFRDHEAFTINYYF
jgi:hypothetical protein